MATTVTQEEQKRATQFNKEEYRAKKQQELREGRKDQLIQELNSHNEYLTLVNNGEVDDILSNIERIEQERKILKEVLQ